MKIVNKFFEWVMKWGDAVYEARKNSKLNRMY